MNRIRILAREYWFELLIAILVAAGMGVLYVGVVAFMFFNPALRRMDAAGAAGGPVAKPPVEAEPAAQARICTTMKAGL